MQVRTLLLSLPVALAINAAEDAGGPQSPPTYTDTSGLSTLIDTSTWASYATGAYPSSYPDSAPPTVTTTTPPHPIINGTIATGGGYSTSGPSASGNLSTTSTGTQHPSTSVVVATVTGSNGGPSTQTSVQVVSGSGGNEGGTAASSPAATGSTQSGDGGKIRAGAAAAFVVLAGFLALM